MASFRQAWLSEDYRFVIRAKRLLKALVPWPLQRLVAGPYYRWVLRQVDPLDPAIRALVHPGDFVIDVGASIGLYARGFSELVGASGLVWAFEPMPETVAILQQTVGQMPNVRIHPCALSDAAGPAAMTVPRMRGGVSLYDAHLSPTGTIAVTTAVLDGFALPRPPTLLKIDVEGHELACLRGAVNIISRWHPAIMIETLDGYTSGAVISDWLAPLGYERYAWVAGQFVQETGPYQQDTIFLAY